MSKYLIGFYNDKVDDPNILNECNIVFNDFDKLKRHLREGDNIILASAFSLYGIPTKEILAIKNEYKLVIEVKDEAFNNAYDSIKTFYVTIVSNMNEFIMNNKETILKLLEEA